MKKTIFCGLITLLASSPLWAEQAVSTSQSPSVPFQQRWAHLPPTPAPVKGMTSGYALINGVELYYATLGQGSPVILLHGGIANSDYWGKLVPVLARHHRVIIMDSRGHGRSSRDQCPYSYDLMTSDVIRLMDYLHIARSDVVGWSDGAIIGLDMAMNYPDRMGKLFAFAPNTRVDGVKPDADQTAVFKASGKVMAKEYRRLSKTPDDYDGFVAQINHMWQTQPDWSDSDLKKIKAPTVIADGDHDEAIKRSHLEYMARTIPGAGLLIIPNTSHFAFLQAPKEFNDEVVDFLDR